MEGAPLWLGFIIGGVLLALVWFLATQPAKGGTRLLLIIESVTVALILIVTIVILVKLVSGTAPQGRTFDLSVFTVAPGTDISDVFLGVVFGFLSFAGFEAAATLGEEAKNPRKDIPRAILGTAIFGGVYSSSSRRRSDGFRGGILRRQVLHRIRLAGGDLSTEYVSAWLGHVITLGATISAVACALASVVGASRLVFALHATGLGPASLKTVSAKPRCAESSGGCGLAGDLCRGGGHLVRCTRNPSDLFIASGTAGTLILLVAYVLATIGAIRLLFFSGTRRVRAWEIVIPALGLIVLGYTLVRNIYPFPVGAAWWGQDSRSRG